MPTPSPRSGDARRLAPLTVAILAIVPAGPALAQQQPTLTVNPVSDSVLATSLPYGPTTVRVTRPDALTGAPVVIGQYAEVAPGLLPFTVNTTTPTAFYPRGDCWFSGGALTLPGGLGLTPDIRGGDTVTVTGGLSLTVPAGETGGSGGPIPGCDVLSTYGRNRIATATAGSTGISVTGAAQPLATAVLVTATDGRSRTAPVDAALAADGTWTAEIPAEQLAKLADGTVTVDGVYAVPDVATGAPAHIAGAPLSLQKTTADEPPVQAPPPGPAPATPSPPPPADPPAPPAGGPAAAPPAVAGRLTAMRATKRVTLARARRGGIKASFVVPAGTEIVRVRLSRATRTTYLKSLSAGRPGTRQIVRLTGASFARKLRRGRYVLAVKTGPSRALLGAAVTRTVTVR